MAQPEEDSLGIALGKLKIWSKINAEELHGITKKDVKDLFSVLDQEEQGQITVEDLMQLKQVPDLQLSDEDLEDLAKDCDRDGDGKINFEELYKGLTRGDIAFNLIKESLNRKAKTTASDRCERAQIIDWLHDEYDTSGALWSLPQTFVLFFSFLVATLTHLELDTAFKLQTALKGIYGFAGEGGALDTDINSDVKFWDWMANSFVSNVFDQNLAANPYPGRIASTHELIGGIQISRTYTPKAPCSSRPDIALIFDPQGGECYGIGDPVTDSEFILYQWSTTEIGFKIANLTDAGWVDKNTTLVDIGALYLNGPSQTFTVMHTYIAFPFNGVPKVTYNLESFNADPFMNTWWIIPDIVFCLILFKMFYSEMQELVPAALGGFSSFLAYLEFWNVIDWLSICGGATIITMFGVVSTQIVGALKSNIMALPTETLNTLIVSSSSYLASEQVEEVMPHATIYRIIQDLHSVMDQINEMYSNLRLVVFFYNFILMMKFFKAFRANPRLNIVIETLVSSSVDMAHFGIVFAVIFLVFSCSAYVAWGSDMERFSELGDAMMSCFRMLMGDADYDSMFYTSPFLTYFWYLTYNILVFLILLNFLLAIVMDTYAAVKGGEEDPITIWRQVREAVTTVRETRGYLDLWYLICQFEDDEFPAHPAKVVTARTLRRAFEKDKISKANAEYLMNKTLEWLKRKEGEMELSITDAIRIIALVKTTTLRIAEVVDTTLGMLQEDRRRPMEARFDAILNGVDPDAPQPPTNLVMLGSAPSAQTTQLALTSQWAPSAKVMEQDQLGLLAQTWGGVSLGSPWLAGGVAIGQPTGMPQVLADGNGEDNLVMASQTGQPGLVRQAAGMLAGGAMGERLGSGGGAVALQRMVEMVRSEQRKVVEGVESQLREQQAFIETQRHWLDQRYNGMEQRCKKIEHAVDRLAFAMQDIDFQELAELPRKIASLRRTSEVHGVDDEEVEVDLAESPSSSTRMEGRIDALGDQLAKLVSHAEENAEIRKLLWKVDMGLKALRQGVPTVLGEATGPLADPAAGRGQVPGTPSGGAEPSTRLAVGRPVSSQREGSKTSVRIVEMIPEHDTATKAELGSEASASRTPSLASYARLPGVPTTVHVDDFQEQSRGVSRRSQVERPRPSDSPSWSASGASEVRLRVASSGGLPEPP